jgi:hypothetical protein
MSTGSLCGTNYFFSATLKVMRLINKSFKREFETTLRLICEICVRISLKTNSSLHLEPEEVTFKLRVN